MWYIYCCGSVARISPRSTCSGESRPVTVLTVVQDRAHNLQWVEKLDPGVHPQILCCHTRETTISGLASLDLCPKTWRSYIIELLRYEVFRRVGAFWVIGVYLYIYIYIYIAEILLQYSRVLILRCVDQKASMDQFCTVLAVGFTSHDRSVKRYPSICGGNK